MFLKIGNTLNFIYEKLITIMLIVILLICSYFIYDIFYLKFIASANDWQAYKPTADDPSKYKELSPECIGWITINNTTVDYPIMQAKDNIKYLNTNPYGEYSLAGSIFLDYKNNKNFTDPFSLIYGHHMESSGGKPQMFGALDLFEEVKYFNTHTKGVLTAGSKRMPVEVFAFAQIDANQHIIFDPTNYSDQYTYIMAHSKHKYVPKNKKRIVALSTCKDPGTTERTIIFLSIIEK